MSSVNPLWLKVEFGAFSDNFVYSIPADFGGRILNFIPKMVRTLLQKGFLIRGGITVGKLYHKENVVFGPALIEAVKIEGADIDSR